MVRHFTARRGETSAVRQLRERATTVYENIDWPDRAAHVWRYTDPAQILPTSPFTPGHESEVTLPELRGDGAVALLSGEEPMIRLSSAAQEAGVELLPLGDGGLLLSRLGTGVALDHGLPEALNAAAWSGGVALRVPRGVRLEDPIHLRIVGREAGSRLPRLLLVVESGADVTLVEEHVGGGENAHVVGVTELFVDANATARHTLVQRWENGTAGHLTFRARLAADAQLLTVVTSLGGRTAKLDLGAVLDGRGARSEMVGVTLGDRSQHLDHHTVHDHRADHTWSNLDFKVALAGRARSAYTGLIRITEAAPTSEAYQENRNLLLSDLSRADSIPELEILTDDVTCTHGATVAPIDPEQRFYLESRGLDEKQALDLIVRGFLENTVSRLPERLRATVEELITERLAATERTEG